MDSRSINSVADGQPKTARTAMLLLCLVLGLVLIVPSAWAFWTFKDQPLQPWHPAMATVVAIAPTQGRSDRQTIVVRNAHGVGSISMLIGAARCDVGDKVRVNQRGTTLTADPSTCR